MSRKQFKGIINLHVCDLKPDWKPFTLPRVPEGVPNVLVVLFDDTGLGA